MAAKRRFLFSLLGLFMSTFLLAAPSFAATYFWTGADCQITNNAAFSNAGNWMPLNPMSPPTPTPGPSDILIFDTAYKLGSCTNDPFDDISGNILNQIAHWGGITITGTFDGVVAFSNWGGLNPLQDPTSSFNVDLRVDGDLNMDPSGSRGIRFSSASTTNKVYANNYNLASGVFNKNTANPFMFHGDTAIINDPFSFNSGDCNNGLNAKNGGFNMTTSIEVNGVNMMGCYYKAPTINIDPGITNLWRWDLANGDDLYFEDSTVYWRSDNTLPSSYEIHQNHAANSFNVDNTVLMNDPANVQDAFKIQLHQGGATFDNALINVTSLFLGNSIIDSWTDSNIIFSKLFFHDGASSTSWTNTNITFKENGLLGGGGFGFNTLVPYNGNLLFDSPLGAVTLDFYPTTTPGSWNYPAYNITSNNVTIADGTLANSINTNVLTLNGNSGLTQLLGVTADTIIGDPTATNQPIDPAFVHANYWIDIDKFSGTVPGGGDIEYYNVTYTDLPTLDASPGTIVLRSGGTPHEVRNQLLPASGSTIIQAEINFTWSEEWGVDGYQCQIDESADNFASPLASWTTTGVSNTTHTYDTNALSQETNYQWRCRTYKDDELGTRQYSAYNSPANFFYLYTFDNVCYNGAGAIDMLSQWTTPSGDTPDNRTLFTKNVDYTFVTYNLSNVQLNYTYNDTVYVVTDTASVGAFLNSVSTLRSNDKTFSVPLQNTVYYVDMIGTLGNGSVCQTDYQFAVGDISTGGGVSIGNITITEGDGQQQTFAMTFIGAILLIMALIFFYLGKSNKSEVNVYDNDYGR